MNYLDLRKKYPEFIYESFKTELVNNDLKMQFVFLMNDVRFTSFVIIKNTGKVNLKELDNYAFNLGLIELISYWKSTYSPKIIIKAGYLDEEQKSWWKKLYINGLGQYFYENKIDFINNDFDILTQSHIKFSSSNIVPRYDSLIAVSGGVDSTLSVELLQKETSDNGIFMMNPTPNAINIANKYKVPKIIVERGIDPELLELNKKGYLNGHTPISAYLAFLSVMCADIFKYKNVIFSNERSSNESNVNYLGKEINHQYSKTFEFEKDFREYSKKYLTPEINYFSFLRPLYNLQISKLLAVLKKNFKFVRSCNVNQKSGTWCLTCPKCLSTFILLYPFLTETEVLEIFEGNIYEDESLFPLILSLIDEKKVKPFECVGTREEIIAGLYLSVKKNEQKQLPILLDKANNEILNKKSNLDELSYKILNGWNSQNFLPLAYEKLLRNQI